MCPVPHALAFTRNRFNEHEQKWRFVVTQCAVSAVLASSSFVGVNCGGRSAPRPLPMEIPGWRALAQSHRDVCLMCGMSAPGHPPPPPAPPTGALRVAGTIPVIRGRRHGARGTCAWRVVAVQSESRMPPEEGPVCEAPLRKSIPRGVHSAVQGHIRLIKILVGCL